jgi:hypothetical protein
MLGAGIYSVLLCLSFGFLADRYLPPHWWIDHVHGQPFSSAAWFSLINAAGALSAAVPVGIGLVFLVKAHVRLLSLAIGVLSAMWFTGYGVSRYGLPKYAVAWVVDAFQFLSVTLAVLLMVVLFTSRSLTNGFTATAAIAARLRFPCSRSAAREP